MFDYTLHMSKREGARRTRACGGTSRWTSPSPDSECRVQSAECRSVESSADSAMVCAPGDGDGDSTQGTAAQAQGVEAEYERGSPGLR